MGPSDYRKGDDLIHDPLCRQRRQGYEDISRCPDCELIALVREEERGASDTIETPFNSGYVLGRTIAGFAILEASRDIPPSGKHFPGCWKTHPDCAFRHAAEIAMIEE